MSALAFPVTCLYCGGEVEWMTGSTCRGASTSAVVGCSECRREWFARVTLEQVARPESVRRHSSRQAALSAKAQVRGVSHAPGRPVA